MSRVYTIEQTARALDMDVQTVQTEFELGKIRGLRIPLSDEIKIPSTSISAYHHTYNTPETRELIPILKDAKACIEAERKYPRIPPRPDRPRTYKY